MKMICSRFTAEWLENTRCFGWVLQRFGQERAEECGNAKTGRRPTANAESSHIKHPTYRKIFQDIC